MEPGQGHQDPFFPLVQRERGLVVAPHRRNPNTDIHLRDRPIAVPPNFPARSASPIRSPPGRWVAEPARDPRGIRAAAAALHWADDRGRMRVAAAAQQPWVEDRSRVPRYEEVRQESRPAARPNDEQAVLVSIGEQMGTSVSWGTPASDHEIQVSSSRPVPGST